MGRGGSTRRSSSPRSGLHSLSRPINRVIPKSSIVDNLVHTNQTLTAGHFFFPLFFFRNALFFLFSLFFFSSPIRRWGKKRKERMVFKNLDGFQARLGCLEIANAGKKRLDLLLHVGISTAAIELREILVQMYEGRQRYHRRSTFWLLRQQFAHVYHRFE